MPIPSPWVFSSPKRDCSHGTFTVLCSLWVGNPRGKGRWDWVPARGGTRPPLLPITATYLEKVILGLQHLPGQVSNAEESHIRGAVDNGQVNQPAAGTEMEKKKEKSVPCDPSVPSEHRRVPSLAPSRRRASSPGRCSGEPEGWLWPLGGRLGAGWLPGEFQLPAAGRAGRHFCFPLHRGGQQKPGRNPAAIQVHRCGTIPAPASPPAHADFLFSLPHPSPLAMLALGRGTPELPAELGGRQRAPVPDTHGCLMPRQPGLPQPEGRFPSHPTRPFPFLP